MSADPPTLWEVVADLPRHGDLMPRVESFEEVEDGWRWVMEEEHHFGQPLQPRFTVRYELDRPDAVRFTKVARPGDSADASGEILLSPDGAGTEVSFRISIGVDVAIPSLLRGPANSMLRREVEGLVTGFLDNLEDAVTG